MKQVAGSLRLDLAQYREMAAFAQFGSDLDKTTQAMLSRGARMVQLLKQNQYQPLPVDLQVMVIFAGVNGYVDDLPEEEVRRFEKELIRHIEEKHSRLREEFSKKKAIDDEFKASLKKVLDEFKEIFKTIPK